MGATAFGTTINETWEVLEPAIEKMVYDASGDPLFKLAQKNAASEEFGSKHVIRFEEGDGDGMVSHTFATANTNQSTYASTEYGRWEFQPATLEALASWDRDSVIRANKAGISKAEKFDIVKSKIEHAMNGMVRRIVQELNGGNSGVMAQIIGSPTTTASSGSFVIDASFANRFEKNARIQAAVLEKSGAVLTSSLTVTGIDVGAGASTATVYTDLDPNGSGWADAYFIFHEGDRDSNVATSPLGINGIFDALPLLGASGLPVGDSYGGINRRNDPRKSGYLFNASGQGAMATALIKQWLFLGKQSGMGAGSPDGLIVSSEDYGTLAANENATKIVQKTDTKANISFSELVLMGTGGKVTVEPSGYFGKGNGVLGPFRTKAHAPILKHYGKLINVDDFDGNKFLRDASSTRYVMRFFAQLQFFIRNPGLYSQIINLG